MFCGLIFLPLVNKSRFVVLDITEIISTVEDIISCYTQSNIKYNTAQ